MTADQRGPAFDDLTARARIRGAAMEQFAARGFEGTTIRGIAAAAGVSAGLLRHHFGSKQELRDAVDSHVLQEIRRIGDEVVAGGEAGDLGPSTLSRRSLRPYQGYIVRALIDGSPIIATMFDEMVDVGARSIAQADAARADPPDVDGRTRAAVLTAMSLGIPLLRQHLSRVLGVDIFSDDGDRLVALALLDLYSHVLVSPELAESALAGLRSPDPH